MNLLEHVAIRYPASVRKRDWQEAYECRRRTGGTHRAAVLFANMSCPDRARLPVPGFEYTEAGRAALKETVK